MEYQYITLKWDLTKKYKNILHPNIYETNQAKFDFLHNGKIADTQIAKDVVQELQFKFYITICHYNKQTFGVNEEVEIFVNIKNIPKLQVKVFEINTDNYFRKNMSAFSSDINLDGLIAKYETEYTYNDLPSNLQHTENFYFPQFKDKRGLFVIEFIGNGISSRAIVQKGNMTLIQRCTIAGQFCYILDENQQVCKGEYTGLYFDNNFYKADVNTGRIIVPFGRYQNKSQAIMIYKGFAQLANFTRETETYNFHASFILHNESVTLGNLAKILVKPILTLNNMEIADLRLLEDTVITLVTSNQIDNITVSKEFTDVKLTNDEEYEIEFQVPNNISTIQVSIATQVKVASTGEKSKFSAEQRFNVNNHSHDYEFCETYLRNYEGKYEFLVKGKNGEPKKGILVEFEMKNKYYYNTIKTTLKTDKDGVIHLGKLRNITQFTATTIISRMMERNAKVYILPENSVLNYPTMLNILDNETIKLPFKHKQIKPTNLSLIEQTARGEYLENKFGNVKLIENKNNKFGINYIEIKGLQDGLYNLYFKKEDINIYILVHEGKLWNQDFIIKQSSMIERRKQRMDVLKIDSVNIFNIEIEEDGEKVTQQNVKVEIGGEFNQKNIRLHAWVFQFYPHNLKELITNKFGPYTMSISQDQKQYTFADWKNIYLSNRALSDENRYILERKYQEKTVGNFLEKPTMLLKRNFIQDTTFEQEQLNAGGNYQKIAADVQMNASMMGPPPGITKSSRIHEHHMNKRCLASLPERNQNDIIGFQNFLQNSAETYFNVNVVNGETEFTLNLQPYTSLLIVATSDEQFAHQIVNFKANSIIPQRDLSLKQSYNQEKSFAESRRSVNCLKFDSHIVDDITSTEMQIVDSLEKVVLIQKELKKFNTEEQELIEHMIKWPSYNNHKRSKVYSDFCCHEFNIFLKLKDPQYFDQTVQPFLTNKVEKTFVDYWLLNQKQALEDYEQFYKLQELNAFELTLIASHLVQSGKIQQAESIMNSLQLRSNPPNQDEMNRIYDIVLNMNSLNSKPSDDVMSQFNEEKKEIVRNQARMMKMQRKEEVLEKCSARPMAMAMAKGLKIMDKKKEGKHGGGGGMECLMLNEMDDDDVGMGGMFECESASFEEMQDIRREQKQDFKELDITKEYAETQYFKIKRRQEHQNLITSNLFWAEFAQHIIKNQGNMNNFMTPQFTLALNNLNEAALAIAMIDLPFKDESHGFKANSNRGVEIKAASNMILFFKEIQESETNINKDLLVAQRYFEKGKDEREIEEFLVNEVYACQVVVTNISSKTIKYQTLVQIPEGSLPLNNTHFQKSFNHQLSPFSTFQFTYYFYFPTIGAFNHFPANVSINRVVVAKSQFSILIVKKSQTSVNEDDFDDVLATENIVNILNFMRTKNILDHQTGFQFQKIYWLCKDKTFYFEGLKILRSKNIFNREFWAYSTYHLDLESMKEFFNSQPETIKHKLGSQFKSSLISVNNFEESHDIFNFKDYYPLVNARAHRLGGMDSTSTQSSNETKSWILNKNLKETYKNFIMQMLSKKEWTSNDKLMLVNYLLMQERVSEAIFEFRKIKDFEIERGFAQLQYDYMLAYLDFYECGKKGNTEFKDVRVIVDKYQNYPVDHWRKLFDEMREQLQEIDNAHKPQNELSQTTKDNIEDDERQRKRKQVKAEPQLNFDIEGKIVQVDYENIQNVRINYYQIDLEILFSKTPFLNSVRFLETNLCQDAQDFSFVQPFAREEIWLDASQSNFSYPIPDELINKNLMIEVSNLQSGIKQVKTYYSANLKVRIIENFGEIKVFIANDKGLDIPLPKTYVKVYQKKKNSDEVKFFKDGYTDLRGRFDYGQLSGTSISDVQRFAIFVQNDEYGSLIKEAKPPSGVKK